MPTIIDRLAEDFETVTLVVASVPEVRVLITSGILVAYLAVYATLASDDAVGSDVRRSDPVTKES
jgi:hypothetical protein